MAKWPARETVEIGARRNPGTGKWLFAIIGAGRQVVRESDPLYASEEEARAAARDYLVQTMLR